MYVEHLKMQESKNKAVQFSSLCVNIAELPDASTCIATLQTQQLFTTHLNYLHPQELVKEFTAVVGQDRQLIHVGDCVELSSHHYEVRCTMSCKAIVYARAVESAYYNYITKILHLCMHT